MIEANRNNLELYQQSAEEYRSAADLCKYLSFGGLALAAGGALHAILSRDFNSVNSLIMVSGLTESVISGTTSQLLGSVASNYKQTASEIESTVLEDEKREEERIQYRRYITNIAIQAKISARKRQALRKFPFMMYVND